MEEKPEKLKDYQVSCTQVSRWSKYLDTPEEKVPEDNVLMDQEHHHGNNRYDLSVYVVKGHAQLPVKSASQIGLLKNFPDL